MERGTRPRSSNPQGRYRALVMAWRDVIVFGALVVVGLALFCISWFTDPAARIPDDEWPPD
jgi:hypothetical protein